MMQTIAQHAPLAVRLRTLRESGRPGGPVTQIELADALGIRPSNISGWENLTGRSVPSVARLETIAGFFATSRSQRAELLAELTRLRGTASAMIAGADDWELWRYHDYAPIRIVCGRRPGLGDIFADPRNNNYIAMEQYADSDALIDLYGQLRAANPDSDVQYRLVDELTQDDLRAHLVVLGNLAQMQDVDDVFTGLGLPVRQVPYPGLDGEVFEVRRSRPAEPTYAMPLFSEGHSGHLVQDIGLLVRMPSPLDRRRTLSLCSGVFTRGVTGVARLVSGSGVGATNSVWLRDRFRDATTFGVLLRVAVRGRHVLTPDLTSSHTRLKVFAEPDHAAGTSAQ
jgi:transcriptional regulator with XRE-family HTH domain